MISLAPPQPLDTTINLSFDKDTRNKSRDLVISKKESLIGTYHGKDLWNHSIGIVFQLIPHYLTQ